MTVVSLVFSVHACRIHSEIDEVSAPDAGPADVCQPEPDEDVCARLGADCGILNATARCGERVVQCGTCDGADRCVDNVCICVPETDEEFCSRLQKNCGTLTGTDDCGEDRTANCGTCDEPLACGEMTENVCGCPCSINGECVPEGTVNPDNPCLVCDPSVRANAWSPATAGTECDDDNPCTEQDTCGDDGLCTGTPIACQASGECRVATCNPQNGECEEEVAPDQTNCADDGLSCTDDFCKAGVCEHVLVASRCLIGQTCYAEQSANPDDACQLCDPTSSADAWSDATGIGCVDGDGLACTTGRCNAGTCEPTVDATKCMIDDVCYNADDANPDNPCESCQPSVSRTAFSPRSGTSCADRDAYDCTQGVCQAGTCVGEILADRCLIGGTCYIAGQELSDCQVCDPSKDQTDWTARNSGSCGSSSDCECDAGACVSMTMPGAFCL